MPRILGLPALPWALGTAAEVAPNPPFRLEASQTSLQSRQARFELVGVDHAFRVSVDQSVEPTPQPSDLPIEGLQTFDCLTNTRRLNAALMLICDSMRVVQHGLD